MKTTQTYRSPNANRIGDAVYYCQRCRQRYYDQDTAWNANLNGCLKCKNRGTIDLRIGGPGKATPNTPLLDLLERMTEND